MGKIMEAAFSAFYLIFTGIVGLRILKQSENRTQIRLYGIMTLVLVFGDAFHLVPRIMAAMNPGGDYSVSLGIGKMITSITMTLFYLILYGVYETRYEKRSTLLRIALATLAAIRIALCFMPQNDWTGSAPVIWGIYRNIPFVIIGVIMIALYYIQRRDKPFRWMWLAILLSFAFYMPVVLWADVNPMIGMLMMPKTCMYIWIVIMGYKLARNR